MSDSVFMVLLDEPTYVAIRHRIAALENAERGTDDYREWVFLVKIAIAYEQRREIEEQEND